MHFRSVRRPDSSPYFEKNGLLFLDPPQLTAIMDRTIDAQPFLGQLVADPTARGLFSALALLGVGVTQAGTELAPYQDAEILWSAADAALVPILPFDMLVDGLRISMFATIATFGTAQDVTADELRIETLFPADAETEALFRNAASPTEREPDHVPQVS